MSESPIAPPTPEPTNETLKAQAASLNQEVADLQAANEKLEAENTQLENAILENDVFTEAVVEKLQLFADRANWDGNTWRPLMGYIESDPVTIAEQMLDELGEY